MPSRGFPSTGAAASVTTKASSKITAVKADERGQAFADLHMPDHVVKPTVQFERAGVVEGVAAVFTLPVVMMFHAHPPSRRLGARFLRMLKRGMESSHTPTALVFIRRDHVRRWVGVLASYQGVEAPDNSGEFQAFLVFNKGV